MEPAIGGEFPLDALALAALPDRPDTPAVPGWEGATYAGSGRSAMLAGLGMLGVEPGRIWVPEYVCHSVLDSLARAGWTPVSYPLRDDLSADLEAWGAAWRPGACLVLHFFGSPQPLEVERFLAERQASPVVEDRTHDLLGPSRWTPDVAFASLRKWLALPDGGVVRVRAARARIEFGPSDEGFVRSRVLALAARHELLASSRKDELAERYFLAMIEAAERRLDADGTLRALSPVSRRLVAAEAWKELAARRRANHARLAAALAGHPRVRPLHPTLPASACPIGFPVLCDDRDALRARLKAERVYCPVHWPTDRWPSGWATPAALALGRRLMTLPVDQRLDAGDVDRLAALVWRHGA
jgi:hypothetical protein